MNWLLWMAIGMSCGTAIGYEEAKKKVSARIRELSQDNIVKFMISNNDEITDESMIELLFKKHYLSKNDPFKRGHL